MRTHARSIGFDTKFHALPGAWDLTQNSMLWGSSASTFRKDSGWPSSSSASKKELRFHFTVNSSLLNDTVDTTVYTITLLKTYRAVRKIILPLNITTQKRGILGLENFVTRKFSHRFFHRKKPIFVSANVTKFEQK